MDMSFNSPVAAIEDTGVRRSAIINALETIMTRAIVCVREGRSSFLRQGGKNTVVPIHVFVFHFHRWH